MELAHGLRSLPPPGASLVLTDWPFEPLAWLLVALAGIGYLAAAHRVAGWPRGRGPAFGAGLASLFVALATPVATYAHALFWVHMVQHLLLVLVAAPLLLLGAPVTLALRSSSAAGRARLKRLVHSGAGQAMAHPLLAWIFFALVMWVSHFSFLYELSLENEFAHVFEHVLYVTAALLYWRPIVGLDPARKRLAYPVRLAYLALTLPVQAFLGLALYSSGSVLYDHYARIGRNWGPEPLADQRIGAIVMWIGGDLLLVGVIALVLGAWMRHEHVAGSSVRREVPPALPDVD